MTFPRDPDSSLEQLLRGALQDEAESISPAGDGLARIQQRTAARRNRWWLQPVAVLGAAAAVGGAGFTAYALTAHPDTPDSVSIKPDAKVPSTLPTTPTASVSPTISAAPTFPASAFYPFTSAAAEVSWEAQKGFAAQPWITDPVAEAKDFMAKFVLETDVNTVMSKRVGSKTASVTLGRIATDGSSQRHVSVSTVHMQRFGKAWLVLGASDAGGYLKLASPASGARVSSPVTVAGPGFGADEAVQVDVRAIGAPFLTAARGHASFGNGVTAWSSTVAFTPPADSRGAVVVVEDSAAGDGPARIAVVGVTFASESTGYPAYFYGVKNGRVTKFSSRTGAAVSYLTRPEIGGASDPQLVGDRVYYLSGVSSCGDGLRYVPINGGDSAPAGGSTWQSTPGYGITGYSVQSDKVSALFEVACASGVSPQAKLIVNSVINDTSPTSTTTDYPALPPGIVGDPSWSSDQQHLAAVMHTGTRNGLVQLDGYGANGPTDGTTACAGYDLNTGEPMATEVDAAGNVWFATRTGTSLQVVRCIGSTPRVMFTIAGNRQPADIDVAGSGGSVLVTDTDGHVWRWNQGGNVVQLTTSVPVTHLSW